jgi:hypothetical protein
MWYINRGQITTGTEDLDLSGFVDLKDFSIFSAQWMSVINCCDDINSIPDPYNNNNWQNIAFTNINPSCGIYDCWIFGEDFSDPCYDSCGHSVVLGCEETPDFDYTCAFNYRYEWFTGYRIGLCVYNCGLNRFQTIKNRGKCRHILSRHRTQDNLSSGCDESTIGKYNWQVVVTDLLTVTKFGYCRESSLDPEIQNYWWSWDGQDGPCKYRWW